MDNKNSEWVVLQAALAECGRIASIAANVPNGGL
jgi:hypothetical protein